MFKAVVYDADGMVLRGTRFSNRYAQEFGIPHEEMAPFFKGPFEECILGHADLKEALVQGGWLKKWKWRGSVDELLAYWFHCGDTIDDRILDSVAELRKRGVLGILTTNQEKYRAAYMRETLGLAKHFDTMFVSSEVGCKKPQPAFLEKILEFVRTRVPSAQPSDILLWDDRETHIVAAKEFGFDARLYRNFEEYRHLNNRGYAKLN